MTPNISRYIIVCYFAAVLLMPGAATSREQLKWIAAFDQQSKTVSLAYGEPETDNVIISAICNTATKKTVISVFLKSTGVKDKALSTVTLAGANLVTFPAVGVYNEMSENVDLEVALDMPLNFLAAFDGTQTIRIGIPNNEVVVPFRKEGRRSLKFFSDRC